MAETRWRAAAPGLVRSVSIDGLTALFHRPSGQTHLLAEPVPEILAALAETPLTLAELRAELMASYEMEGDDDALMARIIELSEAGLVSCL